MSDNFEPKALRIIDANANRAREGLRVAEDFARFVLDNHTIARELRSLRHDITKAIRSSIPLEKLLSARDTPGDVGASPEKFKPATQKTALDIAVAAFKRIQEATRSLAEYTKPIDALTSAEIETIRYKSYELEKQVILANLSD